MADLGWSQYIASQAEAAWLESLSIYHTKDEFGNDRFLVQDFQGDFVGDVYETIEQARHEIQKLRDAN